MDNAGWSVSHRELMSAIVHLALQQKKGRPGFFARSGYKLRAIELPINQASGDSFEADIHLVCPKRNRSMLVECKTGPDGIRRDQLEKYLSTTGLDVIATGLSTQAPRQHAVSSAFFVLPNVEVLISNLLGQCDSSETGSWGIVRVEQMSMSLIHDELDDTVFSSTLAEPWQIDFQSLPLDRLPYEGSSQTWEIGNEVFRAVLSFYVRGETAFTLEDVCRASNDLWDYFEARHEPLRERIRSQMRKIRGVVLKGWLTRTDPDSKREGAWAFTRKTTNRPQTIRSFQRRHREYVQLLKEGTDPLPRHFSTFDVEQTGVALDFGESHFFPLTVDE